MFSSNSRPLPQRTYSLNAAKHASYFSSVDEDLRDCQRVQSHGQEEDLREALGRMMARVEEMCGTLKSTYQTTADLETQLTLAESNLKLAIANNEMLEDALKSGSLSKDVGWRRSSRETGSSTQAFPSSPVPAAATAATPTSSQSQHQQHPTSIDEGETQGLCAPSPPAPAPQSDSRFFRFRFSSSGRSTPTQPSPSSPPPRTSRSQRTSHPVGGHLTSASLPSLVASPSPPPPLPTTPAALPQVANHELEELREQLSVEKRKSEKIMREKSELESELENLSQALFEEANKMVKVERIKRASAEDELKDVHAEKEALKSALRLIEEDRIRVENIHQPHSPSQSTTEMTTTSTTGQDDRDQAAPPSPAPLYVPPPPHHLVDSAPNSRTASPKPLPHPHRLSHLRTTAPPPPAPAPPPPSAADGFPISPWARASLGEGEEDGGAGDENMDGDLDELQGFSVPQIVTFRSPGEAEMAVPWGDKW
ncbi:hypothetical protein BJV77DRAFT_997403 [Russula vinacea]|nr:hypothetical protein BJV77DRAFT_997403 [Russula vinacea]